MKEIVFLPRFLLEHSYCRTLMFQVLEDDDVVDVVSRTTESWVGPLLDVKL